MRYILAAAVVLCLAVGTAPAGDVTAGSSVEFRGLQHHPLGSATLSLSNDTLVVDNIGSSGEDGVLIDVPRTRYWQANIESLGDPSDPGNVVPDGAVVSVVSRGTIGAGSEQMISSATYEDVGSHVAATIDLTPTGATSLEAHYYAAGSEIHTETVNGSSALLSFWDFDWWPDWLDISVRPAPRYVDVSANIPFSEILTLGGLLVLADRIELLAVDSAPQIEYKTVAITASDVPSITIINETVDPPVGGTTELLVDNSAAPAESASSPGDSTLPIAAAAGGLLLALAGGSLFVRRRFVH